MSTALAKPMMSLEQARACVDEIRSGIDGVRQKVLELHEGQGWKALQYKSWRECVTTEFPGSQSKLYYELKAAQVERSVSTIVEKPVRLPDTHARELAKLKDPKLQAEAWEQAQTTAEDGKITAKHLAAAVQERLPQTRSSVGSPPGADDAGDHADEQDTDTIAGAAPDPNAWWTCPACGTDFNAQSAERQGWVERGHCDDCEVAREEADQEGASDVPDTAAGAPSDDDAEPDPEGEPDDDESAPPSPEPAAEVAEAPNTDLYTKNWVVVSLAELEQLVAQRNADDDFGHWRGVQRALAQGVETRATRILEFVLDGGDLALLRMGLDWSVTPEQVQARYRVLARKLHPDRGGDSEAFVRLGDDMKRILEMLGGDE